MSAVDVKHTYFLRNLLGHPQLSERYDLQVAIAEYILELQPGSKDIESDLIKACKKMVSTSYATRRFENFEKYLLKIRPFDPVYETFFRLSSRQFLKADVSIDEWKSLLENAREKKSDLIKRIHSGLIVKLIHSERLYEAMDEYRSMLDTGRFARHDLRLAIALLRLALKLGKKDDIFLIRKLVKRKNIDRDLRNFSKIKFFEVLSEIKFEKGGAPHGLWKRMIRLLKKMRTSSENKNYIERLDRIYTGLESKHRVFLDIRMAPTDQDKLQKIIEDCIEFQKPFSLIRLGDADSYGLETIGFDRRIFEKDCEARERKWWGENLSSEVQQKIRMQFQQATMDADVIGIPSIFRFVSDLPDPTTSFLAERNQRGSVVVMDSIHDMNINGKVSKEAIFTDNRCHYVLFDLLSANLLAKRAGKAIVVSHHSTEKLEAVFSTPIETIQIPGEGGGIQSLPYRIDELAAQLREKVSEGSLVFVAAGFAGKYLLKVAKDQGAVALDVGAMADYWVGIKSRGLELV